MSDPLNHLGSVWYHSEPSDIPYSPNQFLGLDFFFCRFLQQDGSSNKSCSSELLSLNINHLKKRFEKDSRVILTSVIKIGPTRNSNLEGTLAIISGVHNLPLPHLVP